jgi:hypothetical protein
MSASSRKGSAITNSTCTASQGGSNPDKLVLLTGSLGNIKINDFFVFLIIIKI